MVAGAQWWLAVCRSACATVQLMPSPGGTAAIPCFRYPGKGHSRVSSRHLSCSGTGAILCSSCPGKSDTGAGSGLLSSTNTSTLDTRKNWMPAGRSLGGTGEASDPLEGWDSTGDKCPCRTVRSGPGWTVVAPGSPRCWCGSGLFGAGHSLLSVSAAASSCVAPSVPGGKVSLGYLHPLSPCSTLALHSCHLKISGTWRLTGRSGLWKSSGIPSDTELSEPLVLQEERTTCSSQCHQRVT